MGYTESQETFTGVDCTKNSIDWITYKECVNLLTIPKI